MKHGFNHLGRFSTAYKQLFRESPRETLGRATRVNRAMWFSLCV